MLVMTVLCINTIFACYNKALGKNSYNYGKEAKISEKFRWSWWQKPQIFSYQIRNDNVEKSNSYRADLRTIIFISSL